MSSKSIGRVRIKPGADGRVRIERVHRWRDASQRLAAEPKAARKAGAWAAAAKVSRVDRRGRW